MGLPNLVIFKTRFNCLTSLSLSLIHPPSHTHSLHFFPAVENFQNQKTETLKVTHVSGTYEYGHDTTCDVISHPNQCNDVLMIS